MEIRAGEIFENCFSIDIKSTDLPNSAGLVLFADSQNKPILLLAAANIRRTVKNKFAEQKEKTKKADLKSITAKIYCTVCQSKSRLSLLYYKAVKSIFPQSYKDYITFIYPWFININLSNKIPFFSITNKPLFKKEEEILGPFPSQKSAVNFLKTLEDVYRLCKKCELVNNRGASCPYLQMDACCGVCGGKISLEDYQIIIKDAFEAGANPAKAIEKFQADMQKAASELNFEKAAELKKRIEKLSALKKPVYRWTGDLKKIKIVHIDKSVKIKFQGSRKKKQTCAVFAMNFFEVIDSGDFFIDETNKIIGAVENALIKLSQPEICDTEMLERFAIISYFLYRTKSPGLWINASDGFQLTEFAL